VAAWVAAGRPRARQPRSHHSAHARDTGELPTDGDSMANPRVMLYLTNN
jgi:hypothetical protein